ncbi:MAG: ArnT family glycosyltransferase [Legionella sp.]
MRTCSAYLLITFFSLFLFIPGLANLPVVDRDEAHFSQATRQMVQSGQYFQIRFQEQTRFQKPPGINWLQAASIHLFSHGDATLIWPYRLPSLMGGLLSVLAIFFFARRFVNDQIALTTALFLASTLLMQVESHMAVIDSALLLTVIVMQGSLWVIYYNAKNQVATCVSWAILFWLAMAIGLLLKGVTPLVGALSILTLCWIEGNAQWLKKLYSFFGLSSLLVFSLVWLTFVNHAEHSNYLIQMIQKDLLPKLQGSHESHGKPPFFHLTILPLTFWPVSLFLWQGLSYAWDHRNETMVRFLLAWIVPTWIFFEVMPTKLPQYILPTFPPLALLCALAVFHGQHRILSKKLLSLLQCSWLILTGALAVVLLLLPLLLLQKLTIIGIIVSISMILIASFSCYYAWRAKYEYAIIAVLSVALVCYPLIFSRLLPQLEPLWISRNTAQLINHNLVSDESPLLVVGYGEPSLVMYLNTKRVRYLSLQEAEAALLAKPKSLLLIDQENFDHIIAKKNYQILADLKGYNYSKGRWIHLYLISFSNV